MIVISITLLISIVLLINIIDILRLSLTGKVISQPSACTNSEIEDTWDSVFKEAESGITIFTNDTLIQGVCAEYIAYKIKEDYTYLLTGIARNEPLNSINTNVTRINAYYGNFTQSFKDVLLNITNTSNVYILDNYWALNLNSTFFQEYVNLNQTTITAENVNATFNSVFEETPGTWTSCEKSSSKTSCFSFSKEDLDEDIYLSGNINRNYTFQEFSLLQSLETICTPSWNCTNWTDCINETKTRTCNDLNNCGIVINNSEINQSCEICVSNWSCSQWSTCLDSFQTKTCTDLNNCTIPTNTPSLTQSCVPLCTPNWNCTNWAPKTCPKNETQTKICTDLNNCGTTTGKPTESQSCTYKNPLGFIIIIVVVIILIIGIILLYLFIRNKRSQIPSSNTSTTYNYGYPPQPPQMIQLPTTLPQQRVYPQYPQKNLY